MKKTVLIVEDDLEIARRLDDCFGRQYDTVLAGSGAEALICFHNRAFDLVLVGNELYTEKEWERLVLRYRVSAVVCEPVQVNKRNTYFFFGARFAD